MSSSVVPQSGEHTACPEQRRMGDSRVGFGALPRSTWTRRNKHSFPRFGFPGFPRSAFSPFTYLSRRSLGVGGPVRIHHVLRRLKRLRVKPQRAIYANRSAFCSVFPPRHKFDRTYFAPKVFAEAKSSIAIPLQTANRSRFLQTGRSRPEKCASCLQLCLMKWTQQRDAFGSSNQNVRRKKMRQVAHRPDQRN